MPSAERRAPPPAGVRWRSVRGGATLFVFAWSVLTAIAVASRLWGMFVAERAGGDRLELAARFLLVGLVYQLLYGALAALSAIAAVRITRAPTQSGAVSSGLVSAVGFGALSVVVFVLISVSTTPADQRQLSEEAISRLWQAAIALRGVALGAIVVTFARLARHFERPIDARGLGGLGALLVIDTAAAFYGVLAPGALDRGVGPRFLLIAIQIVFAVLLVRAALQVRWLTRPLAEKEARREEKRRAAAENDPGQSETETAPPQPDAVEPDISPAGRTLAALLVAAGAAALPLWDTLDPRMRLEIDGPSAAVSGGLALGGLLMAFLLFQALAQDAYRARLMLAGGAMLGISYAAMTLYTAALQRSQLVDRFPICESGQPPAEPMTRPLLSVVEGPRLESGTPCTHAGERRAHHLEDHPSGSFQDGVVQMARRFPDDRNRMLGGTVCVLAVFLISGVLVFRAAAEGQGPAEQPNGDDPGSGEGDGEERQVRE